MQISANLDILVDELFNQSQNFLSDQNRKATMICYAAFMINQNVNNFSPILICNTLIESAQLAETRGNIKNFPTFISGEQPGNFHKTYPVE
jgi:hypothetical protein